MGHRYVAKAMKRLMVILGLGLTASAAQAEGEWPHETQFVLLKRGDRCGASQTRECQLERAKKAQDDALAYHKKRMEILHERRTRVHYGTRSFSH